MMLKKLTLAAFALATGSAFAGDYWSDFDPNTASDSQRMTFVVKHAYKTLNAGDAYTIEQFIGGLPGNYQHALLVGLSRNAWQAKTIKEENQVAANNMAPTGDMMAKDWSKPMTDVNDNSRPMRMFSAKPQPASISYQESLKILSTGQGAIDQGLIWSLFDMRSFNDSLIPTVCNEKALDALTRQVQANAGWTEPVRLKYTSLAPKTW